MLGLRLAQLSPNLLALTENINQLGSSAAICDIMNTLVQASILSCHLLYYHLTSWYTG